MKFSITNQGGQFQFWHLDCGKDNKESPMHSPKFLGESVKEFKCARCNKVGAVKLDKIKVGSGLLDELS